MREHIIDLDVLRQHHAAPKNVGGSDNYRYATLPQMNELYALHEAFPALAEVVEAAFEIKQGVCSCIHEEANDLLGEVLVECSQCKTHKALAAALEAFV